MHVPEMIQKRIQRPGNVTPSPDSGKPVTAGLDKRNHLLYLFVLFPCESPAFLDQSSHTDDLHPLFRGKCPGVVCPFEEIEPLRPVERYAGGDTVCRISWWT
jgi:hypothetical protein